MRRWLLIGFVSLATLAAVDVVVAWSRGARPLIPILGSFAEIRRPILVGLIHSQTGPLAISERSLIDAEVLALEEINAKGGIAGRPLEWEIADGRSDPSVFASQARRLIEKDGTDILVGGWSAESRKAMLGVVEERSGMLIFPANFEGIERSSHVVYSGGSANQIVPPAVRWGHDALKARKFYVIGTEEVWSKVAAELAKDAIKACGGQLVGESSMPLVGGDAPAMIERIREAKPDLVLNVIVGDSNIPFYSAYQRAGLTPEKLPVIAFAIAEDELRRFPPGDMAGHYSACSYFQTLERPENLEFVRKFKARYGESRVVSDTMVAAYNGLMIWAQAAMEAGDGDPTSVSSRLERQSYDAPEGIVTIDLESRIAWRPFFIGKARPDGQFDVVWSISKPIQPLTYAATRSGKQWVALLDELKDRWGGRWSSSEPIHPTPTPSPK